MKINLTENLCDITKYEEEIHEFSLLDARVKNARERLIQYFSDEIKLKYPLFIKKFTDESEFERYLLKLLFISPSFFVFFSFCMVLGSA